MKLKLSFTFTLIALSIIGFMVRLPSVFSHYDKELHFLFYFLAAGILTLRSRVQIPVSLHENQGLTLIRGSFLVSA
mgnify:CR=1|jgi:hypothetical protein